MTTLIVDASVALKWLVEEEGSDAAARLDKENLFAPALMRIEVANVLAKLVRKQQVEPGTAAAQMELLQLAPVTIVDHDDALERRALEIALMLGHTVYDCVYLALAERLSARIVTADRRFVRALALTMLEGLATELA